MSPATHLAGGVSARPANRSRGLNSVQGYPDSCPVWPQPGSDFQKSLEPILGTYPAVLDVILGHADYESAGPLLSLLGTKIPRAQ
jgi:hypothetical protein